MDRLKEIYAELDRVNAQFHAKAITQPIFTDQTLALSKEALTLEKNRPRRMALQFVIKTLDTVKNVSKQVSNITMKLKR